MNAIGFKLFTAELGIAAAYVRLLIKVAGSGKAILACGLNRSKQ